MDYNVVAVSHGIVIVTKASIRFRESNAPRLVEIYRHEKPNVLA